MSQDAKLSRTREFITGVQHELIPNLAVGVDYVYRNYDRGTANYLAGYQPGSSQFPLSNIYVGPYYYTDPVTQIQAPYYQICQGCIRPSTNTPTVTITSLAYNTYPADDPDPEQAVQQPLADERVGDVPDQPGTTTSSVRTRTRRASSSRMGAARSRGTSSR